MFVIKHYLFKLERTLKVAMAQLNATETSHMRQLQLVMFSFHLEWRQEEVFKVLISNIQSTKEKSLTMQKNWILRRNFFLVYFSFNTFLTLKKTLPAVLGEGEDGG